jgi:hypothetical protein
MMDGKPKFEELGGGDAKKVVCRIGENNSLGEEKR